MDPRHAIAEKWLKQIQSRLNSNPVYQQHRRQIDLLHEQAEAIQLQLLKEVEGLRAVAHDLVGEKEYDALRRWEGGFLPKLTYPTKEDLDKAARWSNDA